MKDVALKISGIIFLLIAGLHFLRLVFKIEVMAGHLVIPLWASMVGFVISTFLSAMMFRSLK